MDITDTAPMLLRERVRELFDAIDAKRWDSLAKILADDVEYERPGYPVLVGRDRVLRFYCSERVIGASRHELAHVVIEGNLAACSGRCRGSRKDGSAVDVRFADVYEFRGLFVWRRTSYFFTPTV